MTQNCGVVPHAQISAANSRRTTPPIAKDSDSGRIARVVSYSRPNCGLPTRDRAMQTQTCPVCDYALDASAIQVTLGARTVAVCCEECAQKLRETEGAAKA